MILIVDDEPSALVLLEMILKRDSFIVRKATTGRDALRLLDREDEQECELIITDIRMPEMDGKQLVAQLRANPRTTSIPVIMCTSTADRGTVMALIGQRVRDYIVKPVSQATLLAKVRSVLDANLPIIEPQARTIQRMGVTPGECRPMARAALDSLDLLAAELDAALKGHNGRVVRQVADRMREPAASFGAKRAIRALRTVCNSLADRDALEAGDQLMTEIADLRATLRIVSERTA